MEAVIDSVSARFCVRKESGAFVITMFVLNAFGTSIRLSIVCKVGRHDFDPAGC